MRKTIKSIQNQTFKDFEVLIIDGGSSKETKDFLSELKKPFFYRIEKDSGIYEAMNKGISVSKGEWLYFLGAGDVLKDELTIESISRYFNEQTSLLVFDIQYDNSDQDSVFIKKSKGVFKSKFSIFLWIKNTLHHQSIIYNKNTFLNKNFNTTNKVLSDYEFNLFLFKNRTPFFKLNKIIAVCDSKGISKTYNWSLYKEEIKIKTKHSHILFKPFFIIIAVFKFIIKKIV